MLVEEGKIALGDTGQPLHPGVRAHHGRVARRHGTHRRSRDAPDHDQGSAHPHGGHLVRHRCVRRAAVRREGTRAGGGLRLVHRRQVGADLHDDGAARDRSPSSRSPARRSSTATTPTSSAASSSARRVFRWMSSSARASRAARHERHVLLRAHARSARVSSRCTPTTARAASCARRTGRRVRATTSRDRGRASRAERASSRRRATMRASCR